MRTLLLFLVPFIFVMCSSSNQNKFIESKAVIAIIEKNEKASQVLNYDLSECHLLEQYDSLQTYTKDVFLTEDGFLVEDIFLTKEYKNIEALLTNLDKNLVYYIEDTFGGEMDIDFPILKYKNRVFVKMFSTYSSYSFIVDLKKSQRATIALVYSTHDHPTFEEMFWK